MREAKVGAHTLWTNTKQSFGTFSTLITNELLIKFLDIKKITDSFQPEIGKAVEAVLASGFFVRGVEVQRFEGAFASFIGTSCCVGVGNGFDALRLIFKAWIITGVMREGDEVIVPANTYVASILAVTENRLVPILAEPEIDSFTVHPDRIQEKITSRTRAVMVVHLYGRNAMHTGIRDIATRYNLKIIEDNAQATGCFSEKSRTGALGDAAAHSFFPTKNLGAVGDGGAVTTNDRDLAETIRTLGHYGSPAKGINTLQGVNSRLDELQAAVLNLKLRRLDADNARRGVAAKFYLENINHPQIFLPGPSAAAGEHVWHLFVIRCTSRDELRRYLLASGIETMVHYPVPPHKQEVFKAMSHLHFSITEQIHREVLSLPLSPVMEEHELRRVVEAVNKFAQR